MLSSILPLSADENRKREPVNTMNCSRLKKLFFVGAAGFARASAAPMASTLALAWVKTPVDDIGYIESQGDEDEIILPHGLDYLLGVSSESCLRMRR